MPEPDDAMRAAEARFVVVEGIDGSGSTTVAGALVDGLNDERSAVFTREPSDGPVGMLIRLALTGRLGAPDAAGPAGEGGDERGLDAEAMALLFAADRRDHIASEIEPHLGAGRVVVSDRYLLSTLAYQGVDLDMEWLLSINSKALPPDLTIFLDVDVDEAQRRMRGSRWTEDLYEGVDLQRRIRAKYEEIIAAGYSALGPIVRIDGSRPKEAVLAEAEGVVTRFLESGVV